MSINNLNLRLVTPDATLYDERVYEVILPTAQGQIAVLPGHQPLITLLRPGVIMIRRQKSDPDHELDLLASSGGFAEITTGAVRIMADSAERAEDLDELRIEQAKEEARRQISQSVDAVAEAAALARLEVELARYRVKRNSQRRGRSANYGQS